MSSSELSELDEGYDKDLSDSDFDRPVRVKKRRIMDDEEGFEGDEQNEEDDDNENDDIEDEEEADEEPEEEEVEDEEEEEEEDEDEEEDEGEEEEDLEEDMDDDVESELDSEELEFLDYNDQGTPDPDRMTNRQKSMLRDDKGNKKEDFMQLPVNSRQQKVLSQEELALKRTELARRRKNLSERKLEEEKMDTLNRLLYKQPKKSASGTDTPLEEEKGVKKRREYVDHPSMVSWKSSKVGFSLSWGVKAAFETND